LNLFVEQLKALRTTMSSVGPEKFDMDNWISEEHPCGTVACVCGHQAILGDLTHFECAKSESKKEMYLVASKVSDDLDNACYSRFNNSFLSESVWQVSDCSRRYEAAWSKLLTEEQLKHPHLTTESSPEDVVSYIDMLIEILS
jgi:hypothetical protein